MDSSVESFVFSLELKTETPPSRPCCHTPRRQVGSLRGTARGRTKKKWGQSKKNRAIPLNAPRALREGAPWGRVWRAAMRGHGESKQNTLRPS